MEIGKEFSFFTELIGYASPSLDCIVQTKKRNPEDVKELACH